MTSEKEFYGLLKMIEDEYQKGNMDDEKHEYMLAMVRYKEKQRRIKYIYELLGDQVVKYKEGDDEYFEEKITHFVYEYYVNNLEFNSLQMYSFLELSYKYFKKMTIDTGNFDRNDMYLLDERIYEDLVSGELPVKDTLLIDMIARYGSKSEENEKNKCN